MHIGTEIEKELKRQERTPTWLAKKIPCQRSNIYSIFKRSSIDTDLLLRISNILQLNFFELYIKQYEYDELKMKSQENEKCSPKD